MPSAWLPVALLVVIGIAFALLIRQVARRIGRSPNRFGKDDTAHDFVGRVYRVGGAVLLVFLIVRAISPEIDTALGRIPVLVHPTIAWLGLTIMILGSGTIIAAQVRMGASWRIGLDRERTGLVTTGLFAWSRNPTFLGIMAVVLGAFLMAPKAGTAAALGAAWIAFSVQIRMEEEHLHRMHGPAYGAYCAVVPRWIG
ncbi:methyltransferase family protein [Microvirga arabica]|uniref:methyltransferase family protein n=1 Tax=Microvirga arabica TaxID=1128671 RepID=UPI001FE4C76C|nr:isoprenylcysteine carboxylmethyltransferase family protein [Microvirga arabica]